LQSGQLRHTMINSSACFLEVTRSPGSPAPRQLVGQASGARSDRRWKDLTES